MANILIIDDEADMRFAVRMLLERSGHSVMEAASGDDALSKLEEMIPDLALLDMRLPGMDGLQILGKLREKQKDLPIIMVTGYGNVELAEQSLKMGADHYLAKPFHNKELLDVIQQVLAKHGVQTAESHASEESVAEAEGEESAEAAPDRRRLAQTLLGVLSAGLIGLVFWTQRPRAFYSVPYANPAAVVFMDRQVWIADWFSRAIYIHELRRRDLPLKKTYYLPDVHLTGMAVLPNAVYTADAWAHVIRKHRMDDRLSVVSSAPSPGPSPCSLFWDGKYLWSCDLSTGKIYQHQADDRLTVVASYPSPGKAPVGFFKDEKYAWTMDARTRRLYQRRLDQQLTVMNTYALPEWEEGSAPLASFIWRDSELWFTRTGKNGLYRRSKKELQEVQS